MSGPTKGASGCRFGVLECSLGVDSAVGGEATGVSTTILFVAVRGSVLSVPRIAGAGWVAACVDVLCQVAETLEARLAGREIEKKLGGSTL